MYRKLCEVMPGGVSSGARSFVGLDRTPLVVQGAKEDCLIDYEGNAYIDFCMSWGALIHGHTAMREVVERQLEWGTSYGVSSVAEFRLADKIIEMVPSVEQVRFVSSGTEATMSAIRLARGFTGRQRVIKFEGNYHGHADYGMLTTLPYNEFVKLSDDIAAVIVEPIAGNRGVVPGTPEFLQNLREETERVGALLIFDEVITGFRVGPGGAQELYGILPDLTCLGKIMGGGFPAAAFGGRRDIMQHIAPVGKVYQAGTLSGNPIAMVAGLETLERLTPEFYQNLEEKTARFLEPFPHVRVGSMFAFQTQEFTPFFQALFDRKIYISPSPKESCFLSAAHTEEHLEVVSKTLRAACKMIQPHLAK